MAYANFLHDMNEWEERNREEDKGEPEQSGRQSESASTGDKANLVDPNVLLAGGGDGDVSERHFGGTADVPHFLSNRETILVSA